MANRGYVESLLNRLPSEVKTPIVEAFRYVLANLRIGGIADSEKAENFQWIRFDAVTSSSANTEFTIHHGLGETPLLMVPMVPLDSSGSLVRLKVTKAADAQRIYLSSPDTGAAISVLVEV